MRENEYQSRLIKRIKQKFPGCVVIKNDPTYIQGFPDILILFRDRWVALEVKRSKTASKQPNQDYYISLLDSMSYASFIFPENEEVVLDEISKSFYSR